LHSIEKAVVAPYIAFKLSTMLIEANRFEQGNQLLDSHRLQLLAGHLSQPYLREWYKPFRTSTGQLPTTASHHYVGL
jgi:hypothetical protein